VNKKKRVGVVKRRKEASKRNAVVTLPRRLDDDDESEYEEDENEEDKNKDDKNEDDDDDDDEDDDEDAVQESITDDGDKGANNNTAGGNGKPDSGSSDSEESSGGRFRDTLEDIEAAAEDAAAEDEVCEVLNRSAQKGTANPPNKHLSGSLLKIGSDLLVRGMSKTVSVRKRQKHVADRITQFVKLDVFCRVKFINSDAMFQQAFRLVIGFENVPPHMHLRFQMLYESAFNDALNTKRSSCEQAGKRIARKALAKFRERGE
jgi:hypothetical protein